MSEGSVRRFLSGVTCPNCGAMDTVRVFEVAGDLWRDCVECGMEERFEHGGTQGEKGGGAALKAEEESEIGVVRFVPAGPGQSTQDEQ